VFVCQIECLQIEAGRRPRVADGRAHTINTSDKAAAIKAPIKHAASNQIHPFAPSNKFATFTGGWLLISQPSFIHTQVSWIDFFSSHLKCFYSIGKIIIRFLQFFYDDGMVNFCSS